MGLGQLVPSNQTLFCSKSKSRRNILSQQDDTRDHLLECTGPLEKNLHIFKNWCSPVDWYEIILVEHQYLGLTTSYEAYIEDADIDILLA